MSAERLILCLLVAALLAMEAVTRLAEPSLSKDIAHMHTFSQLAETLAPGRAGVLVVGNSLARCGIDPATLSEGLPGHPPVGLMVPDATAAIEWAWGYRRHVLQAGARPDRVIIMTGRTHLEDPAVVQTPRLGAFFVGGAGDRLAFLREELDGFEEKAAFLLSSASRLFANRGRIQPLLFYHAVPGYETAVNRINIAAGGGVTPQADAKAADEAPLATRSRTLRNVARLIDAVRESGAEPIVVTAPLPERWSLPEPVADLLRERAVRVVPLGAELALPAERFPDGYHLDPEGARLATEELVRRLGEAADR